MSSRSSLPKFHCGFPRPVPMSQLGCFLTLALQIYNDIPL